MDNYIDAVVNGYPSEVARMKVLTAANDDPTYNLMIVDRLSRILSRGTTFRAGTTPGKVLTDAMTMEFYNLLDELVEIMDYHARDRETDH